MSRLKGNHQKSPWKKSFRKNSYFTLKKSCINSRLYFLRLFSGSSMILYKKVLRKKSPLTSENAWFSILGFSFPRIYFLQDFFSWDLISWDFIGSPHTILGKKVPGIQNTGLYFQWLEKIRTFFQSFYFQVFFPETFFPGLSYIDST